MEVSLKYAIAKAKRNIENNKYDKLSNILDAVYQYSIRKDEIPLLMKSVNKWIEKQDGIFGTIYDELDVKCIINNL